MDRFFRLKANIKSYLSGRLPFGNYFNTPIIIGPSEWHVNERIVELPFVYANIEIDGRGKRILEFGCTRSHLALSLASLGYKVVGIDFRPYNFEHPKLQFFQMDILDFKDTEGGFDYITAVSTVEHIGLGAYNDDEQQQLGEAKLLSVMKKLHTLLKKHGVLIMTVPFGKQYQDAFLRSFSYKQLMDFIPNSGFQVQSEYFYLREQFKFWRPCKRTEAEVVSNSQEARGKTGVNCVACLALSRTS